MAHVHRAHLARIEWLARGWCFSYTRRHAADALRRIAAWCFAEADRLDGEADAMPQRHLRVV
jgi:hypothetical protein